MGTWSSPNLATPPADDPVEMITVEGQRLAVFAFDKPAPDLTFQIGMLPNMFMRDPAAACRGHRSHVNVMRTEAPQSRTEAVALSRAVTLVAVAVARLVNAIAVKWTDADHIVPPSIIEQALRQLVPPRGIAPTLWARLLVYRGSPQSACAAMAAVGTVGLHAFGMRDLEYAPVTKLSDEMLAHPLATTEYLLNSGAILKDSEMLGIPGLGGYRIAFKPRGLFLDTPICLLTPIA